jgi:hypothetical protein
VRYPKAVLRHWYEEGINDGETFRRRFQWALAAQWLLQLGVIVSILLTQ